uniref:Uncharacterized protein n=1 Tax=Panagrolaimus davidi TaxID=227884 RepID=A0A914QSG9_9BILA
MTPVPIYKAKNKEFCQKHRPRPAGFFIPENTELFHLRGCRFKRHPQFDGYHHDGHRGGSRFEEREYERSRYGGRHGGGGYEERGFERHHHGGHGGGFGGRHGGGFEEREYERTRYGGEHGFDRHGDRGYGIGGGRGGIGGIRGGGLGPRDVGSSTITETRGPLGNTHTSVVTSKVSPPHFG